jgi:hypothetical protein
MQVGLDLDTRADTADSISARSTSWVDAEHISSALRQYIDDANDNINLNMLPLPIHDLPLCLGSDLIQPQDGHDLTPLDLANHLLYILIEYILHLPFADMENSSLN